MFKAFESSPGVPMWTRSKDREEVGFPQEQEETGVFSPTCVEF